MQTHSIEMAEVATTARSGLTRFNLYAGIHKAMRAMLVDTLTLVGRTDPADDEDVQRATAQLTLMLDFCHSHVHHENGFVHPLLDARCPGVARTVTQEHVAHLHHIADLKAATQGLRDCAAEERPAHLQALYLMFALFVADNLQHMHVEETVHNAALWAACTDAELIAVHDALVATIPPDETMLTMRWMLPQLHAGERLMVLQGLQAGAPAEVVQAVLDVARPHLSERDWRKLMRGLGRPAIAGLVEA